MSEDILDGSCCAECGCYFQYIDENNSEEKGIASHGHPVVCSDCYDDESTYEKVDTPTF